MESSEQLDQLATALTQFQADMPIVPKLHTAEIPTKSGGKYEYSYADLADIIDAARPHMKKHALSIYQGVGFLVRETDGATLHTISTRVLHSSGQWMESTMTIPHLGDIRALGSSITYGRRYAYCAALGIISDQDDDGDLAVAAYGEESARTRTAAPPSSSTSTGGRRGSGSSSSSGDENGNAPTGPAMMTAKNRNALVRHLAQLDPPVRGDGVLKKVRTLVSQPKLAALTDLTADQGVKLFADLGIVDIVRGGPRPDLDPASAAE